jgi:hypothetical protein
VVYVFDDQRHDGDHDEMPPRRPEAGGNDTEGKL